MDIQQITIYLRKGIFFLQSKKKLPFLAKNYNFWPKKVSNFFGSESGKMKLIFLIYTFFKTSVQKTGDGYFFFSKVFGLGDI